MVAIQDMKRGGYLYPVSYRKGQINEKSVGCGPFPKDFGTVKEAQQVIRDIQATDKYAGTRWAVTNGR